MKIYRHLLEQEVKMRSSGGTQVLIHCYKKEQSLYCGKEMRQRAGISRGSGYEKANKSDMGGTGERQNLISVRLVYVTLMCAIPAMNPSPVSGSGTPLHFCSPVAFSTMKSSF